MILKQISALLLSLIIVLNLPLHTAAADISYMPDVTTEMTDARFWSDLQKDADEIILTQEEIAAFNRDTIDASGTMVMDLKSYVGTFDGLARNEALKISATADAKYYAGWTYDPATGKIADWSYFEKMIENTRDPNASAEMPYRYGIAVNRTVLKAFPSDDPIWDDPADVDFDYQTLSAVRVNEPLVIYTTSADGKYHMARIHGCTGWIAAKDVALCADRDEWLSAWDLPSEDLLIVYGNKIWTEASIYAPEVSRRLLTQGTALELVRDVQPDEVIINRHPFHNYVVYLPVRTKDGSYTKQKAFLSATSEVHVGYLPLTKRNIAIAAFEHLGDTYGWGGMLDVEDCSGQIRTIYSCFGLNIGRNGNWQWNMNMKKIDMNHMSIDEKQLILDELPLGAALCFPGHEMMYLGKYDGKYYVISTVGSVMSPTSGKSLRVRGVILNTLDTKRANGQTWLQAVNQAFMPCYPTASGKDFDFPEVRWYRDGVAYILKNDLISPDENGCFKPDDFASREVAADALWRLEGRPEIEISQTFSDVVFDKQNAAAISWANQNGIANGYTDGSFAPENAITREQMVTVLWRYAKHKGLDVSVGETTNILSYDDALGVSEYAISAMQWACGAGILSGEPSGEAICLFPAEPITRAQLSVALARFDRWANSPQ